MDAYAACKRLIMEERYGEALAMVEQALAGNGLDPDLWNLKGVILRSTGRYAEASECFERSLQIDPRDRQSS